jgi:hypothetical protein
MVNMAYQIKKEINILLASRDENLSRRNTQWTKLTVGFVKVR